MKQVPLTRRRWTRDEYDRLVGLGVFKGEPLELIGGDLVVGEPQYPYHSSGITVVDYAIRAELPAGWIVKLRAPVALDDESEPEPDVAVVPGSPYDYSSEHPSRPALAVEVADSSLSFDRGRKAASSRSIATRSPTGRRHTVGDTDRSRRWSRRPSRRRWRSRRSRSR